MPVKIRLMRIGAKKRPFYRIVAVDERKKRTGGYLELLGTYNPLTTPHDVKLKQDRIDHWLKNGAQPSDGFLRITGKAPQRPPRKAKKEKAPAVETPTVLAKEEETTKPAEVEVLETNDQTVAESEQTQTENDNPDNSPQTSEADNQDPKETADDSSKQLETEEANDEPKETDNQELKETV